MRGYYMRLPYSAQDLRHYLAHCESIPEDAWFFCFFVLCGCLVFDRKLRMIDGKELYDLSSDPGQRHDIADSAPSDLLAELRQA